MVIWADIKGKYTKEELEHMVKNNTLPTHLKEVYDEIKSWWFHNAKQVLQDNARLINDGGVE